MDRLRSREYLHIVTTTSEKLMRIHIAYEYVPMLEIAAISVIHDRNAGFGAFAGKQALGRRKKVVSR